jgi:hypothetical protein
MNEIAISKFKATCLAVIDHVNKTGKSIVITLFWPTASRTSPGWFARPHVVASVTARTPA